VKSGGAITAQLATPSAVRRPIAKLACQLLVLTLRAEHVLQVTTKDIADH